MRCPFCRVDNDKVIDTRPSEDGFATRRRRECLVCRRRYTTYERLEEPALKVVKKDGLRMPFEREKIKRGLEKACYKRPISEQQIEALVAAIEAEVFSQADTEVESRQLGELVMRRLRELDQVAYVRFASVYREFQDVRDFVEELEPILAEVQRAPHPARPAEHDPAAKPHKAAD
jgi:transcriptional repressor NrdR